MTTRRPQDAEPPFELVEQDEIGYETTHVDAFMARAREARDGGAPLTAEEVRQARFATVNGGYATDEVDDELDRLEEELAAAERQAFVAERGDEDWAADLEERVAELVVAYEPVWAIGTGKVASAEDAQEVCHGIRELVRELAGDEAADAIRILYGGSVKADTVAEIVTQPDVDGGLVGGASLDGQDFAKLAAAAANATR